MVRQSTSRRSFLRAAGGVALASSAPAWRAREVAAGPEAAKVDRYIRQSGAAAVAAGAGQQGPEV